MNIWLNRLRKFRIDSATSFSTSSDDRWTKIWRQKRKKNELLESIWEYISIQRQFIFSTCCVRQNKTRWLQIIQNPIWIFPTFSSLNINKTSIAVSLVSKAIDNFLSSKTRYLISRITCRTYYCLFHFIKSALLLKRV